MPVLRWTVERPRNWADDGDVCSVPDCGTGFDDLGYLIDITVVTSPGEEGYAEVTQWFCQEHYEGIAPKLAALGFMSHNHHGTNLLDAEELCGGYGKCPHPVEYGPEMVVAAEPQGAEGPIARLDTTDPLTTDVIAQATTIPTSALRPESDGS